jgi:hypothetical protein
MVKTAIILGLLLFYSELTFSQETIGKGTAAKEPEKSHTNKLEIKPTDIVKIETDVSANFYLADPSMPISVPRKNLTSRFPVKKLPKDFPSNLPIYGPKIKNSDRENKAKSRGFPN